MARLLDEFISMTEALNAAGVNYAVCGGWAMAVHGFARATFDIDFLVLIDDFEKAKRVAAEKGFDIEGSPLDFDGGKSKIRRISKIVDRELYMVDFIWVTETYQDVWESRQEVVWNNGNYTVVSREGMIKMKEIAGRDKDLIDLEFLRRQQNES